MVSFRSVNMYQTLCCFLACFPLPYNFFHKTLPLLLCFLMCECKHALSILLLFQHSPTFSIVLSSAFQDASLPQLHLNLLFHVSILSRMYCHITMLLFFLSSVVPFRSCSLICNKKISLMNRQALFCRPTVTSNCH